MKASIVYGDNEWFDLGQIAFMKVLQRPLMVALMEELKRKVMVYRDDQHNYPRICHLNKLGINQVTTGLEWSYVNQSGYEYLRVRGWLQNSTFIV